MFRPSANTEVQDWITPAQVSVVKVAAPAERFEQIMQRVRELREEMGPRYLCNQHNRVQRLDGRTFKTVASPGANVRPIKRRKAA